LVLGPSSFRFSVRFLRAKSITLLSPLPSPLRSPPSMKLSPPQLKQFILTKYQSNRRGQGFDSLARQYGIAGGGRTIQRWYQQWDGTPESLKRIRGSGRPRLLRAEEVQQYITTPIRRKNRKQAPVHYQEILRLLQEKTGKSVSVQTISRYGKENAGINSKRTIKKTKWERKFLTHIALHCCSISFLLE
jgi:transposase